MDRLLRWSAGAAWLAVVSLGCTSGNPVSSSDAAGVGGGTTTGGTGGQSAGSGGAGGVISGPDPCLGATLGDGTYCGVSLTPPGDTDTLYHCKGMATDSAEHCHFG